MTTQRNVTPISLDITNEDTDALDKSLEAEAKKFGPKKTSKKSPGTSTTAQRTARKERAANLVPVQIEKKTEFKIGDVIEPFNPLTAQYKTVFADREVATLTDAQITAIDCLSNFAQVHSVEQTANVVGVHEQLVYRWLNESLFLEALELKCRERILTMGRVKLYRIMDRELSKTNNVSSRVLEICAKSLGMFSDADSINVQVNVSASDNQITLSDNEF